MNHWFILEDEGFDGQFWMTDASLLNCKTGIKVGRTQKIIARYCFKNEDGEMHDSFTVAFNVKRFSDGFRLQCPQCGRWDEQQFFCTETRKQFVCEACFDQVWQPADPADPRAHFITREINDPAQLRDGGYDGTGFPVALVVREHHERD